MLPGFADCKLPSGLRLRYLQQGLAEEPAVIMLHGYTDSWFSFSRVLPLLPPYMRVIALDQRGHGQSDRPESGYTVTELASDVLAVMDELGIPSAVLVGHCMGGMVALRTAAMAPERVSRIVLINSSFTAQAGTIPEFAPLVNALGDTVPPEFIREFQESTVARPVPPEFMDRVVSESSKLPATVWKGVLNELLAEDALPPNGALACPGVVLWGAEDNIFTREDQAALCRKVPNAKFKVLAGVGHSPHWEIPAVIARYVAEQAAATMDEATAVARAVGAR